MSCPQPERYGLESVAVASKDIASVGVAGQGTMGSQSAAIAGWHGPVAAKQAESPTQPSQCDCRWWIQRSPALHPVAGQGPVGGVPLKQVPRLVPPSLRQAV
jgi:hypothetical protein